jgi:hypothetical protein
MGRLWTGTRQIMEDLGQGKTDIAKAGEDLFNFAVGREDVKALLVHLPQEEDFKRGAVEYELQILKIISVGWGISYCLENRAHKDRLLACYWETVYEFSQNISKATGLVIGHDIDYFQILRDRLDMYVSALNSQPDVPEPAVVIGPEFARTCGKMDDVYTIMTGSRMFIATIGGVRQYLEAMKL